MVEKTDGAEMTCLSCQTDLICRLKDYGGDYKPKLQWQNFDGAAHYKTTDGKNFTCVVPADDESQEVHPQEKLNITPVPEIDKVTGEYVDNQITLIRQIESRVFSVLGADANVQKVGMYVKLILEGINKK